MTPRIASASATCASISAGWGATKVVFGAAACISGIQAAPIPVTTIFFCCAETSGAHRTIANKARLIIIIIVAVEHARLPHDIIGSEARSEFQPQRELNDTRIGAQRGNRATRPAGDVASGEAQMRRIGQVEQLPTELKRSRLHERKV